MGRPCIKLDGSLVNALLNMSEDVQLFYDTQSNLPCNGGTWGIQENEISAFGLFPNPSPGIVHIANDEGLELTVRVYDGMGQLVKKLVQHRVQTSFLI